MTWALIATKHLELRKRRGLMITAALLTAGVVVLVLGLRLAFHLFAPATNGPAGSPDIFSGLSNLLAEFGFLVAAAVGAAAGTTDLTDGVFRGLVITGRSRLALYLARIPAGLAVILPVIAVAFTLLCLVTSYAGTPQPTSVSVNGVAIPADFDQGELLGWVQQHPQQASAAFQPSPTPSTPARPRPRRPSAGTSPPCTASTPPRRSPAPTRRSTRWPRSACGSSSRSRSGSRPASASARSPASGPLRSFC